MGDFDRSTPGETSYIFLKSFWWIIWLQIEVQLELQFEGLELQEFESNVSTNSDEQCPVIISNVDRKRLLKGQIKPFSGNPCIYFR
jgi:hypothetical protein